jgi:hypothetical protein
MLGASNQDPGRRIDASYLDTSLYTIPIPVPSRNESSFIEQHNGFTVLVSEWYIQLCTLESK